MNVTVHTYNPSTEKVVPKDAIVLDVKAALNHMSGGLADLPEVLKDMRRGGGIFADRIANQIEAQTKPPRIPEPGLGSHVMAGKPDGTRAEFVRVGSRHWSEIGNGSGWEWDDLKDPTLVRDGIEVAS